MSNIENTKCISRKPNYPSSSPESLPMKCEKQRVKF